jgi:hypothetical protein
VKLKIESEKIPGAMPRNTSRADYSKTKLEGYYQNVKYLWGSFWFSSRGILTLGRPYYTRKLFPVGKAHGIHRKKRNQIKNGIQLFRSDGNLNHIVLG